jgi:hypothetical protein
MIPANFLLRVLCLNDDDAMEAIWKKQFSLAEFVSPDQFKSYEEMKKRLEVALGGKSARIDSEVEDEDNYRGPAPSLTEDLRTELSNLKPTRSVAVDDDEILMMNPYHISPA